MPNGELSRSLGFCGIAPGLNAIYWGKRQENLSLNPGAALETERGNGDIFVCSYALQRYFIVRCFRGFLGSRCGCPAQGNSSPGERVRGRAGGTEGKSIGPGTSDAGEQQRSVSQGSSNERGDAWGGAESPFPLGSVLLNKIIFLKTFFKLPGGK